MLSPPAPRCLLAQRIQHSQGSLNGLILVIDQITAAVHLEHGRAMAGCQAHHLFDDKQAVSRRFTDFHTQTLA